ncbi:MAG: DUF2723 domain-containing protein [Ignavibacteria bacterium]|nr:DUF2723 domain-containing protein [Ignavibacteria bacterium]
MNRYLFALVPSLFCLVVYIITLHPTVTFMDSGELAAVCYTFGIPHPTGYPLYLILGFLFSHLPLPFSVIYKLNLLSALLTSSAVFITFFASELLIRNLMSERNKKHGSSFSDIEVFISASCSSFSCGLISSIWFNATQNEVYALHLLFISVIFYYLLKVYFSLKRRDDNRKYWMLLMFLLGMSFANHLTTVYLLPAVIFLFYLQYSSDKQTTLFVVKRLFLLMPGLLLYSVLMLRASSEPFFNWSDPHNLPNLIRHIRGEDYSQLMFSSGNAFSINLANFLKELYRETGILSGIAGLWGLVILWKKDKKLFPLLMITILTCLLVSFNYNIIDISSYYAAAYYILSLLAGIGLIFSLMKFSGNLKTKLTLALAAVVITSIALNFKRNDNSSDYLNEDYTLGILNNLQEGSIIFTMQFADIYSGSMYFQHVEKLRSDVKVFMLKFLSAPWFLKTIEKYYPDIYALVRTEAEEYISVYDRDERIRVQKLSVLVEKFIYKISEKYPLYFTADFTFDKDIQPFLKKINMIPDGLVYRNVPANYGYDSNAGIRFLDFQIRRSDTESFHKRKLYNIIPGMYYETAYYHYKNGNPETAMRFLEKSLSVNPDFPDAVRLKNKIITERKN